MWSPTRWWRPGCSTPTQFADLGQTDPALQAAILTNLLRIVAGMAKRMTQEIALLAG